MGELKVIAENDPVIPPAQQRRALRIINDVNKHVKTMRRFDARINNLHLFDDFVGSGGHMCFKSKTEWSDHPLVQLLIMRRDRYSELTQRIDKYEDVIDGAGAEVNDTDKLRAIDAISRMRQQQGKELEAMEVCLTNIRKELSGHLIMCQRFVADVIKISQMERLLRKKLGSADGDLPDDELDAKIASDE